MIGEEGLGAAQALIPQAFSTGTIPPEQLPARLEQALGLGRNSWPVSAIRVLADRMLELADARSQSAAHELRWLISTLHWTPLQALRSIQSTDESISEAGNAIQQSGGKSLFAKTG